MATYGLKYRTDWQNIRKQYYRLDIYQRGFTGTAKEIGTFCGCALEIQGAQADVSAPIVKTQLRFSVIDAWDVADTPTTKSGNWSEFYTPDATLYMVQLLEYIDEDWQAMWTGYITPDSWQEDLGYRTAITITARDNIGHLKDFVFDMSPNSDGLVKIYDILERSMQKVEMAMDVTIARSGLGPESTQLVTAGGTYLHNAYINADLLDGMDWYQVLERTLEATGMSLRWVGKNKIEITYIRNLPNMGSPYPVPGYQTIEFYGGSLEFEPAVKQIEETVDFKFREEVSLDALGSFQFTAGSAYRCLVQGNGSTGDLPVHSAPLDVLTDADDTVWDTGSDMFNPESREPDSYLVNAEGSDGWKQYAIIPGNRDTDSPSTSFGFHTKTAAVRVSVNFAPYPVGLVDSGSDQGKVTALQYSLSEIKYQVRFEGDGIVRYWTGTGWASDHAHTITREYDSENEYGTALEISLAECKAISAGRLVVTFSNIIYKRWDDSAQGVYARVQSILVGVISTRGVTEDRVTTINNQAYNINVSRQPLFGSLSKEVGFVSPGNYQGAIFYYPNDGSIADQYPYMVRFNGQSSSRAVPLPVLIHQQILCYRYGAARVLNGRCAPVDKAAWIFPSLFRYHGVTYLLQGGTLDLFSGIIEGAVLHEFILFDELWTGTPTYNGSTSYNTDTPGTGHSGGNSGGSPGGGGGGGSTVSVESLAATSAQVSRIAKITVDGVETYLFNDVAWGNYSQGDSTIGLIINGTTRVVCLDGYGGGGGSTSLGGLSDVSISSPSGGQALVYRNGTWVNETLSGGGTLPIASPTVLGGIMVGTGLTINSAGVLSVSGGGTGGSSVIWGTPGGDYIPLSVDGVTYNLLTDHQSLSNYVTLNTEQTITGPKTFQSFIDIGNARLIWDGVNNALHITKKPGTSVDDVGLYADGDVASGGVGSGGGSVVVDDTVTQNSANAVKSSGIYAFVTGRRWVGTQAQYDALGSYDSDVEYLIIES